MELDSIRSFDYDVPSWAFKQAHLNGKAEAYREVIKLLEGERDQRTT